MTSDAVPATMEGSPDRVKWIQGVSGRWMYPFVGVVPYLIGSTMLILGSGGILPPTDTLILTAIVAFWGGGLFIIIVAAVRLYLPFNRRIGISRSALLYDVGLRTWSFPWELLYWVSPTLLRARAGFWAYWGLRLNLTAEQAARVRELQITTRQVKLDLESMISIYDPR
jgi:hypothetical protein